jgi:hypothetical protein
MKKFLMITLLSASMTVLAQDRSGLPLPSSGNVTLPLDEYNKLIELASKPEIEIESAPISYAIKRADLKLRVTGESVLGTVQCDGEIFTKGINKIPLMNTPAVLSARQANKMLPLMQEKGMHTAILSGPGEFSIMLDAGMPLNIETGRASFNLPVPAAGSAQLFLEVQGEHTNVKINPGLITRRSTENGKTIIEATLAPDQIANIWWTTREVTVPVAPREVRFLSDVKTLVSLSEADMRLAALANITVIQGELAQFEVEIPPGFEMTGVTGATLESEEIQTGRLILKTTETGKKNHQFLISLEKAISAAKVEVPFVSFKGTQRETGEILIEGAGTMELSATEGGTLKRMDLKEVNAYLRTLARHPLHAAFRYHRQPSEPPSLALTWNRFPDSSVLAAGAEFAEITTLITSEGRSLTEIKLFVKNQAQPFLKVGLPSGASIVTAEVAGQTVKPVQGADGTRVPLLRTGFRPSGLYPVTFVIMHAGAQFAKKGDSELSLPKMDIPISFMKWEVFLPEKYKVKDFLGDAIATNLLPPSLPMPILISGSSPSSTIASGIEGGRTISHQVVDEGPNFAQVIDARQMQSLPNLGNNVVDLVGMLGGVVAAPNANLDQSNMMIMGSPASGVQIIRDGININETRWNTGINAPANAEYGRGGGQAITPTKSAKGNAPIVSNEASANIYSLQRRVAGVLPIRVDVPRAGASYSFIRPLVLDEETKVTFRYKSK